MKQWMAVLKNNKKRQLTMLMTVILLIAGAYCVQQYMHSQAREQQLSTLKQKLSTLAALQARLPAHTVSPEQMDETLRESAQQQNIAVTEWSENQEGVQATLAPLPFDLLLSWLASLQQEQGIRVVKLEINRQDQAPGMVNVVHLVFATQTAG